MTIEQETADQFPMTFDELKVWVHRQWELVSTAREMYEEAISRRILTLEFLQEMSGGNVAWLESIAQAEQELLRLKSQPFSFKQRIEIEGLLTLNACTRAYKKEIVAVMELLQTDEGKAYLKPSAGCPL